MADNSVRTRGKLALKAFCLSTLQSFLHEIPFCQKARIINRHKSRQLRSIVLWLSGSHENLQPAELVSQHTWKIRQEIWYDLAKTSLCLNDLSGRTPWGLTSSMIIIALLYESVNQFQFLSSLQPEARSHIINLKALCYDKFPLPVCCFFFKQ